MKKFTGTKIFAWIFILISVSIFGYQISDYLGTLKSFSIPEKMAVKLYDNENIYILDLMKNNSKILNGNRYYILDTNSSYTGIISPKNNQMYSYDKMYLVQSGAFSLVGGKTIYYIDSNNRNFHWTQDNKYYIKYGYSLGKQSKPTDIYIYDLEQKKALYLGLIDPNGKEISVKEIVGIVK